MQVWFNQWTRIRTAEEDFGVHFTQNFTSRNITLTDVCRGPRGCITLYRSWLYGKPLHTKRGSEMLVVFVGFCVVRVFHLRLHGVWNLQLELTFQKNVYVHFNLRFIKYLEGLNLHSSKKRFVSKNIWSL